IAFLNWSEATELDKKMAEAEKARETTAEDEPYLKQIRLLKKQLNEKTFNCQVLENEVERLQAELRKQSSASTSSSSTLTPTPTPTLPPTTNSATPNTEV